MRINSRVTLMLCGLLLTSVVRAHDGTTTYHAFRMELDAGEGRDNTSVANWDLDGWIGGDKHKPESANYVVAGLTGLAPYYFETEAHLFVSEEGDFSFRLREENDFLLTQKLILQPYLELNVYAQDVKELEVGSGLSDVSLGLQLRYEITRKIAPYVEVSYGRLFGDTADYANSNGEDRNDSSVTAGIRLMF